MGGLVMSALFFLIIGLENNKIGKAVIALYVLTNFCLNAGPNTTTLSVPGEVFPTQYRSTAYGISAASAN